MSQLQFTSHTTDMFTCTVHCIMTCRNCQDSQAIHIIYSQTCVGRKDFFKNVSFNTCCESGILPLATSGHYSKSSAKVMHWLIGRLAPRVDKKCVNCMSDVILK